MNIETAIIAYLKKKGYKASANVPATRPDEFVTVERTGGSYDSYVLDRPTVAIQAWATSKLKASELAYKVRDDMLAMVSEDGINKVTLNSLYNFPDTESGTNRYQAVFDLVTY